MLSVLYCSDQLDGVCAAACVTRALRLKGISIRFGGTLGTDDKEKDLLDLANQTNCALFIVDYPPENIPKLPEYLKKLAGRCTIAYWSFSQPQKEKTIATLAQYAKRIDYSETRVGSFPADKLCSTDLAAYRFLPGDPVGKQLTALSADIKFWLRQDERATKLADLLTSGFDKKQIIDALSKGVIWDDIFERARTEYLEKKAKAFDDLLKRLTIKEYLTYKLGFSLAQPVLSTADACQYILDKHSAVDVAVALYRSGKIAFRRRDGCDLDLGKLAKNFDGGGQKFASGGKFSGKDVSADNWDNVMFALDRSLKDVLLG